MRSVRMGGCHVLIWKSAPFCPHMRDDYMARSLCLSLDGRVGRCSRTRGRQLAGRQNRESETSWSRTGRKRAIKGRNGRPVGGSVPGGSGLSVSVHLLVGDRSPMTVELKIPKSLRYARGTENQMSPTKSKSIKPLLGGRS